jgi:cyclic pyranopterin phosphate synthase
MSSHLTDAGDVHMVDVGVKQVTRRMAVACGSIAMSASTLATLRKGDLKKGDAFAAARIAGIQAAKRTSDIIPLCHPLALESVEVRLTTTEVGVNVEAEVRLTGKTGVEMEALTAVAAACLTLYDMGKSLDRAMTIGPIYLQSKEGGKSGRFERAAP